MLKAEIKRNTKEHNEFKLTLICTEGALLAIEHALVKWAEVSAVALDVHGVLVPAMEKAEITVR